MVKLDGSSASPVLARSASHASQNALAEQPKACPTVTCSLNHLESIHVSFGHAVAVGHLQRRSADVLLSLEPCGEGFQLGHATSLAVHNPSSACLRHALTHQHAELADEHAWGVELVQPTQLGALLTGFLM